MGVKMDTSKPDLDELVKEFCRENNVALMAGCPKCGMKAREMLWPWCQHRYCPLRDWAAEKKNKKPA